MVIFYRFEAMDFRDDPSKYLFIVRLEHLIFCGDIYISQNPNIAKLKTLDEGRLGFQIQSLHLF